MVNAGVAVSVDRPAASPLRCSKLVHRAMGMIEGAIEIEGTRVSLYRPIGRVYKSCLGKFLEGKKNNQTKKLF